MSRSDRSKANLRIAGETDRLLAGNGKRCEWDESSTKNHVVTLRCNYFLWFTSICKFYKFSLPHLYLEYLRIHNCEVYLCSIMGDSAYFPWSNHLYYIVHGTSCCLAHMRISGRLATRSNTPKWTAAICWCRSGGSGYGDQAVLERMTRNTPLTWRSRCRDWRAPSALLLEMSCWMVFPHVTRQ